MAWLSTPVRARHRTSPRPPAARTRWSPRPIRRSVNASLPPKVSFGAGPVPPGRRLPADPRRAAARRQRPAQPGHVRHDLDGAAGAGADGRVRRQEHDRQGRVPADRRARAALRGDPRRPVARAVGGRARPAARRPGRARPACSPGWRCKRRWAARGSADPTRRPNLVMGANVQVCWEKFCRYWDVEPRIVPMERRAVPPRRGRRRSALCDENTIGVVAHPRLDLRRQLRAGRRDRGRARRSSRPAADRTSRSTSTARPAAMIAPFLDPDLVWDFRLPRVASINTSGHKYGLVYPGVGWVLWRDAERAARGADLQRQLPRRRDADLRAQLLPPGRRGRRAVLHVLPARPVGLPRRAAGRARRRDVPGRRHRRRWPSSGCITRGDQLPVFAFTTTDRRCTAGTSSPSRGALRERGWQVPAYTFPADREDLVGAADRVPQRLQPRPGRGLSRRICAAAVDELNAETGAETASGPAGFRH